MYATSSGFLTYFTLQSSDPCESALDRLKRIYQRFDSYVVDVNCTAVASGEGRRMQQVSAVSFLRTTVFVPVSSAAEFNKLETLATSNTSFEVIASTTFGRQMLEGLVDFDLIERGFSITSVTIGDVIPPKMLLFPSNTPPFPPSFRSPPPSPPYFRSPSLFPPPSPSLPSPSSNWAAPLEVSVYSVGERTGDALHPEPYKQTEIRLHNNASGDLPGEENCFLYEWQLYIPPNEQTGLRNTTKHEKISCGSTTTIEFKDPGWYNLSVSDRGDSQGVYSKTTLQNMYVRREVRSLTNREWLQYVDAVWTLRNISTDVGRERFTCPSGNQSDYKEYDFFILFHSFHSANSECDQLHFSLMQEFAHEAWNTLFERALQCVHPETSLHYWNEMKDSDVYGYTKQGLLTSAVWNATMYGSSVDDENGAAYVNDGAFAYFPLRNNRTGLCEYLDPEDYERCEDFIENKHIWRGNKTHTGFFLQSPRGDEDYAFVSRRTGHLFGRESDLTQHTFPNTSRVDAATINTSFYDALQYITDDEVHGHAHYWISGLWGGDETAVEKILDSTNFNVIMFRVFVWPLDTRGRFDGCITCTAKGCTCATDSHDRGCWNGNLTDPTDSFDVQWHGYDNRSWWADWLGKSRDLRDRKYLFQCKMMRGGTFDRSSTANADPTFYIHHSFTFWLVDRAKRSSTDPPPYYDLEERSKYECPGHKLDSTTVFSHLVPYTTDQTMGQRHTWREILFMLSDERRTARWE